MEVLAVLLSIAAAATPCVEPARWAACPVAQDLHPVGWDYGAHYQRSVEEVMSGRRANPLFVGTANRADVHYRLAAASGRGLDLATGTREEWAEIALAGSVIALDRMLGEVVDRSEEASAVRTAFETMIDPSVDLVVRPNGKVEAARPPGGPLTRRYGRASETAGFDGDDDSTARSPRYGAPRPPPRLHLGVGWTLRDLDASPDTPPLSWGAELSLRNVGITLWRADFDIVALDWSVLARQRLADRWSVGAALHSARRGAELDRWAAGLYWNPSHRTVVSLQWITPIEEGTPRIQLDARWMLGANLVTGRAPAPLRPNRLISTTSDPAAPP